MIAARHGSHFTSTLFTTGNCWRAKGVLPIQPPFRPRCRWFHQRAVRDVRSHGESGSARFAPAYLLTGRRACACSTAPLCPAITTCPASCYLGIQTPPFCGSILHSALAIEASSGDRMIADMPPVPSGTASPAYFRIYFTHFHHERHQQVDDAASANQRGIFARCDLPLTRCGLYRPCYAAKRAKARRKRHNAGCVCRVLLFSSSS